MYRKYCKHFTQPLLKLTHCKTIGNTLLKEKNAYLYLILYTKLIIIQK